MIVMQIIFIQKTDDSVDVQISGYNSETTSGEIEAYDMVYDIVSKFLDERQEEKGFLVVLPGGKQEKQDG